MQQGTRVGLRTWIWRAFLQTALIPLILVETVLIAIYLLTNASIRDTQVDYLRDMALNDLQASAVQEAHVVQNELSNIGRLTSTYAALTRQALSASASIAPAELGVSPDGVRYSLRDEGGAASFYANSTPLQQQDLRKVARLTTLDPLMRETVRHNPLVASIYFNSWDSYNHIYPWFDTLSQYPHDMVIPDYNFYYQAAPEHNPQRKVAWTDVYLDPAGHGWMLSAIAPVFRQDFLEGVVGLDITVSKLLEHIDALDVPWNGYAMIVSDKMNIMALPPDGEDDFGLDELTSHTYSEAISKELFKPEDFNLHKRSNTQELAKAMAERDQGVLTITIHGLPHLVAWATIEATDWHLLTVVAESQVFAQTDALASHYRNIGYLLIAGLVLFYLLFFAFMWGRTRVLSSKLKTPINGIAGMLQSIGKGSWHPLRPDTDIDELEDIIQDVQVMGEQLERKSIQLQQASQDAQEASRAKSQFISSMSHELRTPLNAIQGFAQLMHMSEPQAPKENTPDYLKEILLASRHLNQLVGDILDWSSMQSERPHLELQKVNAIALLNECAELVGPEAEARGLSLKLVLPASPLWIMADPRRLRQVLLNLLSNALKYTPSGSVTLKCAERSDKVRLTVADTGIGIPLELQELLFEPFQRLGQENTAIQGTGIGLSLCKEYAALMGASLGFDSQVNVGSRFWIDLPHASAEQAAPSLAPGLARVFYADRDPQNRAAVLGTLRHIELEHFDNGRQLLEALLAKTPDMLLLGTELEGLEMREVLREIHQHPELAAMPVVLLSREEQAEELIGLGASALLGVPVDPAELQQLVRDLTRKEHAHAE